MEYDDQQETCVEWPPSKEIFVEEIMSAASEVNRPKGWRYGQTVFNYVDHNYGLARYLQLVRGIDCFYNDEDVDLFIDEAWKLLLTLKENDSD